MTDYTGTDNRIPQYRNRSKLAADLWKSSSGHNEVIIGDNDWSFIATMGAMDKNLSCMVLEVGSAGYYDIEGYEIIHP